MANGATSVDVPDDIFGHVLEEDMQAHGNIMSETMANAQHGNNLARLIGVKKYNEVGAIESAAAEVVMRIRPS
jgi:hypothetical protein